MSSNGMLFQRLHLFSLLLLVSTVSLWAILADHYTVPLMWLLILSVMVLIHRKTEFIAFMRRFLQIGGGLMVISILQIVFRREGDVILSYRGFNLIYASGLMEAILLWIRFMLLFVMATLISYSSVFYLYRFLVSIHIPLNISMLFSTTIRLIPFIYLEARRILWFFLFRGIRFNELSLKNKLISLKKILYSLLMKSVHYISYSGLALELRGYGVTDYRKMPIPYPLTRSDYIFIAILIAVNILFGMVDQKL